MMNIADRIQNLRKTKGVSQEQLADVVGVSRQAVSKWESEQTIPDLDKVVIMSEYFGVTTDFILKGIEPVKEEKRFTISNTVKAGIVMAIGLLSNLVLFIMSRLATVPIPFYYIENGQKMVTWSGDRTGHSFKYFLEFHDIELLAVLAWILIIGGLIWLLFSKGCFKGKKIIISVVAVFLVVVLAVLSFWAPQNYEKNINSGAVDTNTSEINTGVQE